MKRLFLFFATALLLASCSAHEQGRQTVQYQGVNFIPMSVERLPDMAHPRSGHQLIPIGGECLVVGGHTTGFVIEPTAEVLRNRRWTELPMLYSHDTPFALVLKDGRVMIGGGYAENFGIGQSWGVEYYDPQTRAFAPAPILDVKRAHCSAVELSGGKVAVSGNWYFSDGTEVFDGDLFDAVNGVVQGRSYPYVLRSDVDNAIIFGSISTRGEALDPAVIDRLHGDSFEVPLLRQWRPVYHERQVREEECFIGDMSTGRFDYLISAADTSGRLGLILVKGESFSLLELEKDIPTEGPWGRISWTGMPKVNRNEGRVCIVGTDESRRIYIADIEYAKHTEGLPAQVTVYYSEIMEGMCRIPLDAILSDGRIILAGGNDGSNYEPTSSVFLATPPYLGGEKTAFPWHMVVICLALLLGIGAGWFLPRKKSGSEEYKAPEIPDMMTRIVTLMDEKELFRKKDLRLSDLAQELGTNITYVSACINGQAKCTFPEFVTGYRLRYAQQALRRYPDKLISEISDEAGFMNEKAFYRTFKAHTGLTPAQWRAGEQTETT